MFIGKYNLDFDKGCFVIVKGVYDVERWNVYNNVNVEIFGSDFELDFFVEFSLGYYFNGMLLGVGFFNNFIV